MAFPIRIIVALLAFMCLLAAIYSHRENRRLEAPTFKLEPSELLADGHDVASLDIVGSGQKPRISVVNRDRGVRIENTRAENGFWHTQVRSGVVPGIITLRIDDPGRSSTTATLNLILDSRDQSADGTPDFLRLDTQADRDAFRRWFTFLAESQYFEAREERPTEIKDCAALIRYAYREALHAHDEKWAADANLKIIPAFTSVEKYQYPLTALGPSLFRIRSGPFRPADLRDGSFLQFADARSLWRYNTHLVSKEISRAQSGDLLFFRQDANHVNFHSMIYLGESQLNADGIRYVVYHTGQDGSNPGEIRRLSIEQLLAFPQSEWRPLQSNPNFLGVFRWNILREGLSESDGRKG